MIYSFQYEGRFVNLVPLPVREGRAWNVFNAHSMSLLVGANGSGKTELLSKLCESIHTEDNSAIEVDGVLSDYGVIYFTPAPLSKSRFPRNGKRFKVLDGTKVNSTPDHDVVATLAREFQFANTVVARLAVPLERGLDAILAAAMEIPVRLAPELKDYLGSSLRDYTLASQSWRELAGKRGGGAGGRQREMLRTQGNLRTSIRRYMRHRYGTGYSNIVLAAIAFESNGVRTRASVARKLRNSLETGLDDVDRLFPSFESFRWVFDELGSKVARTGAPVSDAWRARLDTEVEELLHFEISGLSSGAEALVRQFIDLRSAIDELQVNGVRNVVLMIDEGDAFLHLAWQQKYINFLNRFIYRERGKFETIQVIVATHSPVLMSDFPRDFVIRVGEGDLDASHKCFGAPLETIIESTAGAGTIGEFSARVMKRLVSSGGHNARDRYLVGQIDDPVVRNFLARRQGDNIN